MIAIDFRYPVCLSFESFSGFEPVSSLQIHGFAAIIITSLMSLGEEPFRAFCLIFCTDHFKVGPTFIFGWPQNSLRSVSPMLGLRECTAIDLRPISKV